jgi:hypothetical protein
MYPTWTSTLLKFPGAYANRCRCAGHCYRHWQLSRRWPAAWLAGWHAQPAGPVGLGVLAAKPPWVFLVLAGSLNRLGRY